MYVILLDFLKAFDKVLHQRLLHKRTYYHNSIDSDINQWDRAFLEYHAQ